MPYNDKNVEWIESEFGVLLEENKEFELSDGNRGVILIKNSKGLKDRNVPFSLFLKDILREYFKQYRPKVYLFEGKNGG